MNAVTIGIYDFDESELMPINEKDDLQIQVAKLETNVQHIREDVSDIKVELRATNQRIDTLSEKMDKRFDALIGDMNQRFDKVDSRFDALIGDMNQRFDKVDSRFDAAREEVNKRFDKQDARLDKSDARMDRLEEKLNGILIKLESWKVWALGLYVALAAALLGVMAKGFKWF